MRKTFYLAAALALTLSACASAPQGPDKAQADSAISAAVAANDKAASVGYEWRDTGKLIKEAEEAAKAGEFEKAIKLANKAQRQAEIAQQQHAQQQNARPNL